MFSLLCAFILLFVAVRLYNRKPDYHKVVDLSKYGKVSWDYELGQKKRQCQRNIRGSGIVPNRQNR